MMVSLPLPSLADFRVCGFLEFLAGEASTIVCPSGLGPVLGSHPGFACVFFPTCQFLLFDLSLSRDFRPRLIILSPRPFFNFLLACTCMVFLPPSLRPNFFLLQLSDSPALALGANAFRFSFALLIGIHYCHLVVLFERSRPCAMIGIIFLAPHPSHSQLPRDLRCSRLFKPWRFLILGWIISLQGFLLLLLSPIFFFSALSNGFRLSPPYTRPLPTSPDVMAYTF